MPATRPAAKPAPFRLQPKVKLGVSLPNDLMRALHTRIGITGRSYSEEIAAALAPALGLPLSKFGIAPTEQPGN